MSGFVVKCSDYVTTPRKTRDAAEALLARIEDQGACRQEHEIVEVDQ